MNEYLLYFDNRTSFGPPMFVVQLGFSEKLSDLKKKIQESHGIPFDQQKILQHRIQVEDVYFEDDSVPFIDLVSIPNCFLCITGVTPIAAAGGGEEEKDETFEKDWPREIKRSMKIMGKFVINCCFQGAIPWGVNTEEISVSVVVCRPILSLQAIQGSQIGLKAPRRVNLPAVLVRVNTFLTLTYLRIELDRLRDSLKAFPVPKFYSLFHVIDDRLSRYTGITEHCTFSELEIKDEDVILVCELPFAVQSDWVVTVRHHEDNASGGTAEVSVEIEPWKTLESLKKILVNHPSGFQTPELQNYMLLHRGKLMREKESFLWHGVSFADHIYVVPVAMGPDQGDRED